MGGGTAVPLTRPGRLRRALRALLADVTPLRHYPAYCRLWFGETVAAVGSQLTVVAVAVQVFALTGSSFAVGLLGLVDVGPLVAGGLLGGAVADAAGSRSRPRSGSR